MKKILLPIILAVLTITACTSSTEKKTHYYLLNSPTGFHHDADIPLVIAPDKPSIVVSLLELPKYLDQASLVMQLSDHQLHYSHFHMWAEPLSQAFTEALIDDLNVSMPNTIFINEFSSLPNPKQEKITINLTSFQITHLSQALLKGSYQITSIDSDKNNTTHQFSIALDLEKDGYVHAVKKLRAAVNQLNQQIVHALNKPTE